MTFARMIGLVLACSLCAVALGQTDNAEPNLPAGPFDACGTLVSTGDCVLFNGGGGMFYVADTGRFRVGDSVRVVGTLNPNCTTICADADGCISGAVLYDPAVLPCGTPVNTPFDPCSGVSLGLLGAGLATLALSPFARRSAPARPRPR